MVGDVFRGEWSDSFASWDEYCRWLGTQYEHRVDVAVCVPYFHSDCEWREAAFEFCLKHWRENVGIEPVLSQDALTRSAARNECVRLAGDAEVLFFADADTLVPPGQFWAASALASHHHRLVAAYEIHVKLSRESTARTYRDGELPSSPTGKRCYNMPLGAVAANRELFDGVGGFDERFVSWGGEDRAFQYACETLAGPSERVAGDSHHLWHPVDPTAASRSPRRRATVDLATRYKKLAGRPLKEGVLGQMNDAWVDPEGMRALLNEVGGPLAPTPTPPGFAVIGTGRCGTGYVAATLEAHALDVGHEAWWTPNARERDGLDGDVSWMALPDIEYGLWEGPVVHVVRSPVEVVRSLVGIQFFSPRQKRTSPYTAFALRYEPDLERLQQVKATVEWWVSWNERCAAVADVTLRIEDIQQQDTLDRFGDVIGHKLKAEIAGDVPTDVNHRRRASMSPHAVWRMLDGRGEQFGYTRQGASNG